MRKCLLTDPKIIRISSALKADRFRTVGGIYSAWCLLDSQTADGMLEGYTPEIFDELLGFPGLASAMVSVNWLEVGDGFLMVPRFHEHNGQTAKRRAQEAVRKMSARDADKKVDEERKKCGPEKRRVEKSIKNTLPDFCPCSVEQAISHAPVCRMSAEQARHWWNVRNASGWTKGSTGGGMPRRITSWQSDMATSASWVGESLAKVGSNGKRAVVPDLGPRGKNFDVMDLDA